jgi:phosphoribosyl-ATP pyrophosphohydrolase
MTKSGATDLSALSRLAGTIASRRNAAPATSYTAKLLSQGIEKCAKKFGEEAVELALASVSRNRTNTAAEAADVLYHFLVLLEAAETPLSDVMAELTRREGTGGLEEKAARGKDA